MAENRNQVALYQEAADAMRDWARVIPGAVENLREANQKVYSKISDVAGEGGPHTDQILEIVSYLQNELEGINAETENMITMLNIKSHTVEKKKVGNKIYIKKIASEIDNYTICGRRKYGNKK